MIRAMADTNPRGDGTDSSYARFVGLGIAFMLALVVPAAVGFFVDKMLGTLPLFLLVGLGLGFAVGLYYVYQALKKLGNG